MLTVKIARKPLAIGPHKLVPGDVVSDAVEALLPAGRVRTLMDQGWIAERPVPVEDVGVAGLIDRLAVLEEKVAALEARRGPGRPRKVEE